MRTTTTVIPSAHVRQAIDLRVLRVMLLSVAVRT